MTEMEEDLLARLQSLLAYIENVENYYAGFRNVIKQKNFIYKEK